MSDTPVSVLLHPTGAKLRLLPGTPLRDVLFAHGCEFPCGGRGRCKRCRIRVIEGALPVTEADSRLLTPTEIAEGWRLACHARAAQDVTIELVQWEAAILADDSAFAFTPADGLGVAIDLGTTTIVAQLLDMATGHVLAVRTALNPQGVHGSDVMSRVQYGLGSEGAATLQRLIRDCLGSMVRDFPPVRRMVIAGNTVMHHLFCGLDVSPLASAPFETATAGLYSFRAADLDWPLAGNPEVHFLPCLGSFVGSDILAGVLATRMDESATLAALVDLGTNGEIIIGTKDHLICASAAAGPAFEAGRISAGMRASAGAISEVGIENGRMVCHVLGDGEARGICGSGLVDAVACGLDLGLIQPNGRLTNRAGSLPLTATVSLAQADIRELQLAKGAVAAGIEIVLKHLGATLADLDRLYLAGAFGNYVNRASAARIGLIDLPEDKVHPAGNTSLLGAKLALFAPDLAFAGLRSRVDHIGLASDPAFEDIYVEKMRLG